MVKQLKPVQNKKTQASKQMHRARRIQSRTPYKNAQNYFTVSILIPDFLITENVEATLSIPFLHCEAEVKADDAQPDEAFPIKIP